jgi:hypothetical protein
LLPEYVTPISGEMMKVQKDLKGAYDNEVVAGGQYQILPDLTVGAAVIYRWLGRAIEDIYDPETGSVMIGNPGNMSQSQAEALEQSAQMAEQLAAQDPTPENEQAAKDARAAANRAQPRPTRTYKAVQLTATKRFARRWFVSGSYTYSQLRGNYPGLYQPEGDQRDPNLSTQYDVPGIMSNRYGPLPNDRPHLIQLHGYTVYPFQRSSVIGGFSFTGRSGQPVSVLGRYPGSDPLNSFILPRGSAGRTPFVTQLDLHLGYRRSLGPKASAEVFFDLFNVLDQRAVLAEDQEYTVDRVMPLPKGGDIGGLLARNPVGSIKTDADGNPVAALKNGSFRMPTAYQAPISGRVGARIFF